MSKIFVLGIAGSHLSAEQERLVSRCTLVVGTARFKEAVAHLPCRFVPVTPLGAALDALRAALTEGNVAVLAGGDPLFYGIGRRLLAEFSEDIVRLYPALTSIQRACALLKMPWDDARIISLHGRRVHHLPGLLLPAEKSLVLTDATNSPDRIAALLLEYLGQIDDTRLPETISMLVAEDLGLGTEKIFRGTLLEGSRRRFSPLNVLGLLVPHVPGPAPWRFGLTEDDIRHSRGLITKSEVRAATLHRLQLPERGILWDIGAGSGSLSVEAARLCPDLTVYAIEYNAEQLDHIKNNIVKFRCYNIVPVSGKAPASLDRLPAPDRVFIGGSSGFLADIIDLVAGRLADDGRLVINGVIDRTVREAPELMRKHHFTVSSSTIRVTRTETDGTLLDFNPITIMAGRR